MDFARYEKWARNYRSFSDRSIKEHVLRLRQARRWWSEVKGNGELEAASFSDLEDLLFSIPTGPARNSMRWALVNFWEFLRYRGRAETNLAEPLPKARLRKGSPKPISEDQLRSLLEVTKKPTRTGTPLKWECLITVFAGTGLRLSEVTNLKWSAVRGDQVDLVQKGGRERTVFLCAQVLDVLERWRLECPDGKWVFPSPLRAGMPLSTTHVYSKVRELGNKAGIPGLHPHQLRHTFATLLYEASGDIMKVKEALGHDNIANTMVYTQVNSKGLRAAIGGLAIWASPGGIGIEPQHEPLVPVQRRYFAGLPDSTTVALPKNRRGRWQEGVERRQHIRQMLGQGLSKSQMCGLLGVSTQALNKHLQKIEDEDRAAA